MLVGMFSGGNRYWSAHHRERWILRRDIRFFEITWPESFERHLYLCRDYLGAEILIGRMRFRSMLVLGAIKAGTVVWPIGLMQWIAYRPTPQYSSSLEISGAGGDNPQDHIIYRTSAGRRLR